MKIARVSSAEDDINKIVALLVSSFGNGVKLAKLGGNFGIFRRQVAPEFADDVDSLAALSLGDEPPI